MIADHVEVFAVLDGRLDDVMGNQHRLMLQTDRSSASWPGSNARILSYYCTAGARVTMSWTSSRCISRGTSYLRYADGDYRVRELATHHLSTSRQQHDKHRERLAHEGKTAETEDAKAES